MGNLNIFNELSEHVMLGIYACREVIHPSDWLENKQHRNYNLWYLHEGMIEIRIHEQIHRASEGDLILFSPKVAYTAASLSNSCRFTYTHFNFGLGIHHRILDNFKLAGIIPGSLVQEEISLFEQALTQHQHDAPMSGIRLKGSLTILIAKVLECYGLGEYQGQFTNESNHKRSTSLQTLQPIFEYIHDHLHQPIRIEELAELAGMSEKYFIKYFKLALGVTPGLYIYQLKMNRARKLLYSKRYSIQQIADMLGYPDPFSFSKAFKKYYKVPPSQFDL